ncbi:MAG: tRNA pseudouridine(38-40) synthase TruA, partial [Flavobacteriaceae bacterium]
MRYFLQCAYDGAHFSGWQRQPNAPSIQEDLEEALNLLLGEQIPIVAAGRTDAGVHARQMYAHFDSAEIEHPDYLVHRLNAFLHKSISVQQIISVHEEAHAR